MSELDQLKKRILDAGPHGLATAIIRDDYEPAGDLMIRNLVASDEFITTRTVDGPGLSGEWKVWAKEFAWGSL